MLLCIARNVEFWLLAIAPTATAIFILDIDYLNISC